MRLRACLGIAAALASPGCTTFTYSSPHLAPASGPGPVGLHANGQPWAFSGVESLCHPVLPGATRERIAFSVQDKVAFCFLTPSMGAVSSPANPGLNFSLPCQRGATGAVRNASGELNFTVGVGTHSGVLGLGQVIGRLQTAETSVIARAEAQPHDSGYTLTFRFPQRCNPDAAYRLTIDGLTLDGGAVVVPAVDFLPAAESTSAVD